MTALPRRPPLRSVSSNSLAPSNPTLQPMRAVIVPPASIRAISLSPPGDIAGLVCTAAESLVAPEEMLYAVMWRSANHSGSAAYSVDMSAPPDLIMSASRRMASFPFTRSRTALTPSAANDPSSAGASREIAALTTKPGLPRTDAGHQLPAHMPVSYIVDAARRGVLTTMTDVVTVSDLEAFVATLGADPRFEPTFRHLFDCRYIAQVDVSGDDMRRLVTNHLVRSGTRR